MSGEVAPIRGDRSAEATFESIRSNKSELDVPSFQSGFADVESVELIWPLESLGIETSIRLKQLKFCLVEFIVPGETGELLLDRECLQRQL
jgi:hypothetical protein